MKKKTKFKYLEIVVFNAKWADRFITKITPLAFEQRVLFLGEIPQVPGHCAVAAHNGKVIWLADINDFRKVKKSEL